MSDNIQSVKTTLPIDKLTKRIKQQIKRVKFIGDIIISDDEYELLLIYSRTIYRKLIHMNTHIVTDPVFATTLVQIGIRYYDGNYWKHVMRVLKIDSMPANQQTWIGDSFIHTLKEYNKILCGENDRVNNILLHCFVTNKYVYNLFEFLYAFYRIDLERDLTRNDRDTMHALCNKIIKNDNSNRTHLIMKHTADALTYNLRGCKTRLRRLLKLIDMFFWNDEEPFIASNRLTNMFFDWKEESDIFKKDKSTYLYNNEKKRITYHCPHLVCDFRNTKFYIKIPSQFLPNINVQDKPYWSVNVNGREEHYESSIYETTVGYKTGEINLEIDEKDIFETIKIYLYESEQVIKRYTIKNEDTRFFDTNGVYVAIKSICLGECYAYSKLNEDIYSEALIEKDIRPNIVFYYFDFQVGDIIRLSNGEAQCVGVKLKEGIQRKGLLEGICITNNHKSLQVYNQIPSFLFRSQPKKIVGTVIYVNGKRYRLSEQKYISFDIHKELLDKHYLISLSDLGYRENGLYNVVIDIPNDRTTRNWELVYIDGFNYSFEDAPYLLDRRGTISFSRDVNLFDSVQFMRIDKSNSYNFDLTNNIKVIKGEIKDNGIMQEIGQKYEFNIIVPQLYWSYNQVEWFTNKPADIWKDEFKRKLYIRLPEGNIKLVINKDNTNEFKQEFSYNKSIGYYDCDMTKFISYFDHDSIDKTIYLEIGRKSIPLLKIITSSYVNKCLITADYQDSMLMGTFDIIGKNKYAVDVWNKGILLGEKIPIINGKMSLKTELQSGNYRLDIYELEEDEFGFDQTYYFMEHVTKELINPLNLENTAIQIHEITCEYERLILELERYKYYVYELKRISKGIYCGMLIFVMGRDRVCYPTEVRLEFIELNNISKCSITFWEEEEYYEFIYDSRKKIIVKEEERNISKSEAYRRYEFSLYPEDFSYRIEFVSINNKLYRQGAEWIREEQCKLKA